jgi:putative transcriptional regulator
MKNVKDSIIEGLEQAIDYEKGIKNGTKSRTVMISPVTHYQGNDIKQIRQNLGMTQIAFAELVGVSTKTVEAWEAGRNIPQGPAQRILEMIKKDSSIINQYILSK